MSRTRTQSQKKFRRDYVVFCMASPEKHKPPPTTEEARRARWKKVFGVEWKQPEGSVT